MSHIGFIGIDGEETQDEDSPSFYNVEEAMKVAEWVSVICNFKNACATTLKVVG